MKPRRLILPIVFAPLALTGLAVLTFGDRSLVAQTPADESFSATELIEQRDEARRSRDQLQHDLDAMTRQRVDLDGEVTRLRREVETLNARLAELEKSR